ncbi:MAG: T9SS type A sorting domain-containing protein [Bacteroidota bacterium]|nr:T9SS type A sorting domain-containing protein [Bacteroidota bacterium]
MHPRIVTDAAGEPLILWYNASKAMFSRWNGSGFDTPVAVHPLSMKVAGAGWMGPDIAAHGDTVYVVFKVTPEDIGRSWCVASYDGGITFRTPVQIEESGEDLSRFPIVTTDDLGNPLVAFMKFNSVFGDPRWVVAKSDDYGATFKPDVLASGWSSAASEVCDCCPGAIVTSGDRVAMLYRDNNNHVRDTWAGFSMNGGEDFTTGINVDQHQWVIHACPATGPDGVVIGDTLYSTFMNGAEGKSRVYFNKTSLSDISNTPAAAISGDDDNVVLQNYSRISGDETGLGVVWKQVVNGQDEIVLSFTNDLASGLPATYDTVDLDRSISADIAISKGKIFVVWEDNATGRVGFRSGTFSVTTATEDEIASASVLLYPNPSSGSWTLKGEGIISGSRISIHTMQGRLVSAKEVPQSYSSGQVEIDNSGLMPGIYYLTLVNKNGQHSWKTVKI